MSDELAGLIDAAKLEAWLDEHIPELGAGPLSASLLAGGTANAVMQVSRGGAPMVLRRPPHVPRPDSEKIIAREARVLAALNGAAVPKPHLHAYCADPGVIGTRFYVMEWIDGFLGQGATPPPAPFDRPGEPRRNLAFALVDGIAALARVDHHAVGLGDFGKPDGFLERQVARWLAQLESYRESEGYAGREIPGIAYAADWLQRNTPVMSPAGILHGDYSLANALFRREPPARLAAMIDWELATIGDPLLDLGWVLYPFRGRGDATLPAGFFDPTDFPYREELADYYAEQSGRAVENLTYYMVLAQFKLATILERNVARAASGRQTRAIGDLMNGLVLRLAARASEMARRAG